jgi:hypothetical protein
MLLKLNQHDAHLLRELLADYLPELRMEVARTERREYRHRLVDRLDLVERLLEELDRTDLPVPSSERP